MRKGERTDDREGTIEDHQVGSQEVEQDQRWQELQKIFQSKQGGEKMKKEKGVWSEFAEQDQGCDWQDELFDEIQKGDIVYYENQQGQIHKGKAVMQGPMGWVINIGGGRPQIVNEGYNYLGHSKGRNRQPDHLGKFLHG